MTPRRLGCLLAIGAIFVGACSSTQSSDTSTSRPVAVTATAVTDPADSLDSQPPLTTEPPATDPTVTGTTPSTETPSTETPSTETPSTGTPSTGTPSTGTSPTATDEPTTTTEDTISTVGPVGPIAVCAFSPPSAGGEVTWIEDGQLRAIGDDGTPRCLLGGVASQSTTLWSDTGERVLTDPATIVGANGARPSGFDVTNQTVSWSAPPGKALISIDPATHHLIWHSSTSNSTEDISFLARTDEAVYHPAGKGIAAVGMAEDGAYGIWIASNRGENRQLITRIDDPRTPATDLAFSSDGHSLNFIHKAAHNLVLAGLFLTEVGVEGRQEANLTVSAVDGGVAYTTGPCDNTGSLIADGLDLRTVAGSPFVASAATLRPVGWLAGQRLVIAVGASGCDGPADVWVWSGAFKSFQPIGSNRSSVAVRIPHGPFVELPGRIEQAAPG